MFDLENECQNDDAQHPQWFRSIANIKIYKRQYPQFCANLRHFSDFRISHFIYLEILVKVVEYNICNDAYSMANVNLYKSRTTNFYASSPFQYINV